MVEGKKVTTPKKETAPKSEKKGTAAKIERKITAPIAEKEGITPKAVKITPPEKPISREIDEKRKEFKFLLAKFQMIDDPIERYMKRQEMLKIQQFLKEHGIQIDIP